MQTYNTYNHIYIFIVPLLCIKKILSCTTQQSYHLIILSFVSGILTKIQTHKKQNSAFEQKQISASTQCHMSQEVSGNDSYLAPAWLLILYVKTAFTE